jgi:hypothetical protein
MTTGAEPRWVECAPGLVLDGPWRAVIGVWRARDAEGRERVERHAVPWLLELELEDRSTCLWTSHRETGRSYRGVAFVDVAAAHLCAAAELGRLDAAGLVGLCERRRTDRSPLTWADASGGAPGLDHWSTGAMPLREVLRRLGASIVRLEVLEAGGT